MSLPATDFDPPGAARDSRPRWLVAMGWALAAAVSASGAWAGVLVADLSLLDAKPTVEQLRAAATLVSLALAIGGGIAGLVVGAIVTFANGRNRRGPDSVALCVFGALAGAIGGGLSPPTMLLCARWLHPLVSSSALWAIIGLFVGLFGYRWSHRMAKDAADEFPRRVRRSCLLTAMGWALAAAFCTGGMWAGTLLAVRLFFDVTFAPTRPWTDLTLLFVGSAATLGLLAGIGLTFRSKSGERGAALPALGTGGILFGTLAGAAGILAAPVVGDRMNPLVSSSLGMAFVGFLAGLGAYAVSRWTEAPPTDPSEFLTDEDENPPAGAKVEWVLREPKRKWRLDRSLLRVLPVLLATAWALGGAALLAPDDVAIALLAVGVLGLAVAFVLYRQEERLEALEQRLRDRRES